MLIDEITQTSVGADLSCPSPIYRPSLAFLISLSILMSIYHEGRIPFMRIISLLASATEMVAALGCLDQMVGRSHECDYPPEIQSLPVVSTVQININASSAQIDAQVKQLAQEKREPEDPALKALSIYAIDIDKLQELRPDVIFTQTQCEVCAVSERDVIQAIAQLTGLQPLVVSLSPYRLQDVWEDVLRVGKALGKRDQAQALVEKIPATARRPGRQNISPRRQTTSRCAGMA